MSAQKEEKTISKRKITSLSDDMSLMLVEQLGKELYNANIYRTLTSFCKGAGLVGSAKWFKHQAEEETKHADMIFDYLVDSGVVFEMPKIDAVDIGEQMNNDDICCPIFELALNAEIETTEALNKIGVKALEAKDLTTYRFVTDLLLIQLEEEDEARDRYDIATLEASAVLVDMRVGQLNDF